MKTRMQPIGNVLNKFVRIVRDIAADLGKKIKLELVGTETELDKTLLEAIRDPLTHILRNSCDHGIEPPADRVNAGKVEEGTVTIKSYHEGGQVIVEISDDGRGLQKSKIMDKALEKGLVTSDKLKKMTDKEIFELILMPGFSTAEKVSSVSGRGVGMDVVKTNIEKIGGNVEINSDEGRGSEIRMKIPLTLAIVPAMLVKVGDQRFCIPQIRLVELVRVEYGENSKNQVELLQGQPVFRLRGDLLPLVNLEEILNQGRDARDLTKSSINIVVLNSEGSLFGLVVDEILDTADIVVKPLSQFLKSLGAFSGATIMGDGSVALILDVVGISARANISATVEGEGESERVQKVLSEKDKSNTIAQEFLTFNIGQHNKYAIPLCLVHRLEKFDFSEIELSGNQEVVQYRGDLLPIVSLKKELGFANEEESSEVKKGTNDPVVNVIVSQKAGMFFGVRVDDIEDVVLIEDEINESVSDREGLLGNIIYNDQVIVVADILSILDKVVDRISVRSKTDMTKEEVLGYKVHKGAKILLAEDTPFFRRKIASVLSKAGYVVEAVNNGKEALEQLNDASPSRYNVILSDIEMPFVDGFKLAETIRSNPEMNKVPLIAITTRFRDRDVQRGKDVGFDDYLEKLNEEELLKSIDKLLSKGA